MRGASDPARRHACLLVRHVEWRMCLSEIQGESMLAHTCLASNAALMTLSRLSTTLELPSFLACVRNEHMVR